MVKVFTSVHSRHVREIVNSSREGGASLNILSGLTAGNFSAYWLGLTIVGLMSVAYFVSLGVPEWTPPIEGIMQAPAVFAFGLVAFGFLGMGPVTIAVDSYGPVTDNAQSVYELSMIETLPGAAEEIKRDFGFTPNFAHVEGTAGRKRRRGQHLQGHGQAGAYRHGSRRRDDDDFLDHHVAHRRPDRSTWTTSRSCTRRFCSG